MALDRLAPGRDGLESVKKTDQVAACGVNPGPAGAPPAFIHRTTNDPTPTWFGKLWICH
jgi:hypothetical protein